MANFNVGSSTAQNHSDVSKVNLFTSVASFTVDHSHRGKRDLTSYYSISLTETIPGWLTGRRPSIGQQFPRGVYNK